MYWIELAKEIKYWYLARKIANANIEFLEKNNIRVDKLGRCYTVINLPEEIARNAYSREPYILDKLRDYDQILIQIGLTELVFPEFEPIPNTDAYLLVLSASNEYLDIFSFLWNAGILAGIYWIAKIGYHYCIDNGWFTTLFEAFSKYS